MKEQSHKDEMSAALRGDFERLRERGVATTLSLAEHHAEPADPEDLPVAEEAVAEEPAVEPSTAPAEEAPPDRTGVFARLFGR